MASDARLPQGFPGENWIRELVEATEKDPVFSSAAAGLSGRILLDMERDRHLLHFREGQIELE